MPNLPRRQYTVHVKGSRWLARNVDLDLTGGDVTNFSATLLAGDANGDNHVNIIDLGLLADHYNSVLGDGVYDPQEDFNGDGHIDIVDLGILADNYNLDGDP